MSSEASLYCVAMRLSRYYLNLVILLLISACPGAVFGQAELFVCAAEKALPIAELNGIVTAVQTRYQKVERLSGKFIQYSRLEALDAEERSSGQVLYERPGKMRWNYAEPEEQSFIMSDLTLWFYQKSQNQVLVDTVNSVLLSDLPVSFLMGVGDLSKDFTLKSGCRREQGDVVLNFVPNGSKVDDSLSAFGLLVDEKRSLPTGAQVKDVGGNTTTIVLRDLAIDGAIAKDTFSPVYPAGVDVVDRREAHHG